MVEIYLRKILVRNLNRRKSKECLNEEKQSSSSSVPCKETQSNGLFSNAKDLLATGFLEGLHVSYVFRKHEVEIPGTINGEKYICGCTSCKYGKVISALEFEKHAKVRSSQASNHIVLEDGRTLHEIVKHLSAVPWESLQGEIERMIGRSIDPSQYAAWTNDKYHEILLIYACLFNLKLVVFATAVSSNRNDP